MSEFLEKPKHGWSQFNFNKNARISYIDDFPENIIENAIYAIKHDKEFSTTFDAEGYDYTLLSTDKITMEIIIRQENIVAEELPFSFGYFIDNLIKCVEKNIDEWVLFPASVHEITEEENKRLKTQLKDKLKELKKLSKDLYKQNEPMER